VATLRLSARIRKIKRRQSIGLTKAPVDGTPFSGPPPSAPSSDAPSYSADNRHVKRIFCRAAESGTVAGFNRFSSLAPGLRVLPRFSTIRRPTCGNLASLECFTQAVFRETQPMSSRRSPLQVIALTFALALGGCATCLPTGAETGVIYASIDVECGDKTYTVGTGSKKGACEKGSDGKSGICNDTAGNEAQATCDNGCIATKGSGFCSVKSKK